MRIELNGYVITKLDDGRYLVINNMEAVEFIADSLDEAMGVINA